ncbi:hypothetical protein D1610_06905 [Sphingomonas gilva]|uniref:Uncharacterized protein n=1 Tax=Sphingomonas gilva TaxID=2305907 RepID=A0A396RUR9_9SPHN|nr:hypothetical protein [Sphingomonas gilva]RHW18203.1 hypothetical protein D1610_06905 [Sphingomonas gilva]
MLFPNPGRPAAILLAGLCAQDAVAQGYTVGGARPSADTKLKLHAELTDTPHKDNLVLPKLGAVVPVSPDLEMGVDVALRHIHTAEAPRSSGVGDVELKAKFGLARAAGSALGIDAAAELKISLPVGSERRGFGEGRIGFKLPVTFARRFGAIEVGALVGLQHVPARNKDMVLAGLLMTREFGARWKVGAEVATEMRMRRLGEQELMANAGLRFAPNDRSELFIIGGRALASRDGKPIIKFKLGFEIKLRRGK